MDVGRINVRPFINNVSLGVYVEMLGDPAYMQDKLGVAQAKLQAVFSDPELRRALRITPPDEAPLESVVAVVVSNNPYEFAQWDRLGQRYRLDTGTLQVFRARRQHARRARTADRGNIAWSYRVPARIAPLDVRAPGDGRPWRGGAGRGRR